MAPANKNANSTRGKTRMYMCRRCGLRHASPTGVNCPHVLPTRTAKRKLPTKIPVNKSKVPARPSAGRTADDSREGSVDTDTTAGVSRPIVESSSDDEPSPDEYVSPSPSTSRHEFESPPRAHPPETRRPLLPPVRASLKRYGQGAYRSYPGPNKMNARGEPSRDVEV